MGELFFLSLQQDIKIFLFAPLLCAILRALFIKVYFPYDTLKGHRQAMFGAFRYGFWWGMDFNAYVFLFSFVLLTLPSLIFPRIQTYADDVRLLGICLYGCVLYAAFAGKMIFYRHFHDIYNYMLHYGNHAEKRNLLDIFFHQDHGIWVLLGFIPFTGFTYLLNAALLSLPSVPPPRTSGITEVLFITIGFICAILFFYWFRYGGTWAHSKKPEWDTIPTVVKEDIFFARATVDDLIALENVFKHPLHAEYKKTDAELEAGIEAIIPPAHKRDWQNLSTPVHAFLRKAEGARITKPRHIFFIVGESIPQWAFDAPYRALHVCDALWDFKDDLHTAQIKNFLPAGNTSRPSIVSLMSGVYDANMEINEREAFWQGALPTSFPVQMKRLGYQTIYWYGGNASYGNFNHFGKAQGFDRVESCALFCPHAPKTWVGVYDHIFLEAVAERVAKMQEPTFHFIYTTSNHGPYTIPDKVLNFDTETAMPNIGADIRRKRRRRKQLATYAYSARAIAKFIGDMKEAFPDSLFVVTGDHSNLFGDLANTSLIHRDYTLREVRCTVFFMQHPELTKDIFTTPIGTHMHIMPTIIEAIAPQGFPYYSLMPSLFTETAETLVTPYQWITATTVGDVGGDYEQDQIESADFVPMRKAMNHHQKEAEDWSALTAWLVRHEHETDIFSKT